MAERGQRCRARPRLRLPGRSVCPQPGTICIDWDVNGVRERGVYCDDHADRELADYAYFEYEALSDLYGEPVLAFIPAKPVEADPSVLEAARAALERHEAGLRATVAALPPDVAFELD